MHTYGSSLSKELWIAPKANIGNHTITATTFYHRRQVSPREFCIVLATAFADLALHWREYVVTNAIIFRPTDIAVSKGNPGIRLKQDKS